MTEQTSARAVETRYKTHTIHIGSRQLRSEVHTTRGCQPPTNRHLTRLHSHRGLDRKSLHWNNPRLGLQMTTSSPVNAQLRKKGTETVPT